MSFKEIYHIDEDNIYPYLYLRCMICNDIKDLKEINKIRLSKFFIKELNISIFDNSYIYYNDQVVPIISTIYEYIENLEFRASMSKSSDMSGENQDLNKYIQEIYNYMNKKAKNSAKRIRNKNHYKTYYKYYLLYELNTSFKSKFTPYSSIKGIRYSLNHNYTKRSLEEELEALIYHVEYDTSNIAYIDEEQLEDFLVSNLEKIEKGLRCIDRQVVIKEGRVDILAKDINDVFVAIELKVDTDKELIWQCIYYPEAIRRKYKVEEVRMIAICPSYEDSILYALKKVCEVELFSYKVDIKLGQIKDLRVKKYINKGE